LTQRELAARSGVPQSAIARIERGLQVPRTDTLERLLGACGHELRVAPVDDGIDRQQIRDRLALPVAERARQAIAYGRMLQQFRAARPVRSNS
jgi:transcriptional regulator with XRE-family HTH domain